MICRYCNSEINGEGDFCPKCGNRIVVAANSPESIANDTIQPEINARPQSKKTVLNIVNAIPLPIRIALGAVTLLFIITLIIGIATSFGGSDVSEVVSVVEAPPGFGIFHDAFPGQTDAEMLTLSGTISTDSATAHLTLNGELIDTVTVAESGKIWSKSVQLTPGFNTFVLTLTDNLGNSRTEHFAVERVIPLVYQPGTKFVKLNKSEIYIRPTPEISDKYVIKVPANDYTSQFECIGMEHTDSEGYLWCKVTTPLNGLGWVRTDLIKAVQS